MATTRAPTRAQVTARAKNITLAPKDLPVQSAPPPPPPCEQPAPDRPSTLVSERRLQLDEKRTLKRRAKALEEEQSALQRQLRDVQENLQDVKRRKSTRSSGRLTMLQLDNNQVFSIPMDEVHDRDT